VCGYMRLYGCRSKSLCAGLGLQHGLYAGRKVIMVAYMKESFYLVT